MPGALELFKFGTVRFSLDFHIEKFNGPSKNSTSFLPYITTRNRIEHNKRFVFCRPSLVEGTSSFGIAVALLSAEPKRLLKMEGRDMAKSGKKLVVPKKLEKKQTLLVTTTTW